MGALDGEDEDSHVPTYIPSRVRGASRGAVIDHLQEPVVEEALKATITATPYRIVVVNANVHDHVN